MLDLLSTVASGGRVARGACGGGPAALPATCCPVGLRPARCPRPAPPVRLGGLGRCGRPGRACTPCGGAPGRPRRSGGLGSAR